MGLLSSIKKLFGVKVEEGKVLFLGLDNAGKTTILKQLTDEDITVVSPTQGFHIRSLLHQGFKLNVWDAGGQQKLRPYWRNYFESTDALVYVVDSADKDRLIDSRDELSFILEEEKMVGVPMLVLANKQDMQHALPTHKIAQSLNLGLLRERDWQIYSCSAKSGDGLQESMAWILQQLK